MEEYPRLISLLLIFARNNQRAIVFFLFLTREKPVCLQLRRQAILFSVK
ncbi:hypothetical protein BN129_325 [Cronobacter sakazakii 701]|nr:hypothetical protein BN129_325 [Cronobacter sakazakii 701]